MGTKTQSSPTFPSFPGGAVAVTASDTVKLSNPSVIYVGTPGNVRVLTTNGDTVTFVNVPQGSVIPVTVIQVLSTSTTASNMVAVY